MGFFPRIGVGIPFAEASGNGASRLLSLESQGFAVDFTDDSLTVKDTTTAANNYPANGIFGAQKFFKTKSLTSYAAPSPKLTLQANGLYGYNVHNLCQMSEKFDSFAWILSSATLAAGVTDPNGGTAAYTLNEGSATAVHGLNFNLTAPATVANNPYTVSVYAKAGVSNNFVLLVLSNSANHFVTAVFDLSDGTAAASQTGVGATSGTLISTSKVSVGNGWYRLTVTGSTTQAATKHIICTAPAATGNTFDTAGRISSYTGTNRTINIFGAQLNAGYTALTYTQTQDHNVCLQSQTLGTTWTAAQATVTSDVVAAPDGTTTAEQLTEDATGGASHKLTQAITTLAATYTFSIYAKKNSRSWIALQGSAMASNATTFFDVNNGVLGTVGSGHTATITNVGNGWYRCSISGVCTATSNTFAVYLATGDTVNVYGGDAASNLYLWGAQLEQASSPGKYVATTATAVYSNYYSLPYEWSTAGVAQGLLEEVAATNLALQSNNFTTTWTSLSGTPTLTPNAATAPDGTNNAWGFSSAAGAIQAQNITATTAAYTISIYAKADTLSSIRLNVNDGTDRFADFTLTGSGATSNATSITSAAIVALPNGWYRCSILVTFTGTAVSFRGLRTQAAGNVFFWGAQFELGNFLTSYIQTATGTVTRAADVITLARSLFPAMKTIGSAYAKSSSFDITSNNKAILSEPTTSCAIVGLSAGSAVCNDGTNTVNLGAVPGLAVDVPFQIASSWTTAGSVLAASVNGGNAGTGTFDGDMGSDVSIGIGTGTGKVNKLGHFQAAMLLPRALSTAELKVRSAA